MSEYKKSVGIMIPTRKRVKLLKECLDSFNAKTKDKTAVELLVRIDDDDLDTLDFIAQYKSEILIKYISGSRKNGYGSLHEFYNEIAEIAESEYLVVFNDDVEMLTEGWEEEYKKYSGKNFIIALKNIRIKEGQTHEIFSNTGYNGNPGIPADFYKTFGTLSHHQMLDDWWVQITNFFRQILKKDIEKWVDVTILFKRPDGETTDLPADETFLEGRKHINWGHHVGIELPNYINQIINYVNENPNKFIE